MTNPNQLEALIECVHFYEKILVIDFYSPSEFYLYYKAKINSINLERKFNSIQKVNKLIDLWENIQESEKNFYQQKANEFSALLMREKFNMLKSYIKSIRYEMITEKMIIKIKNEFLNKKCRDCCLVHKFCICKEIKKIDFKSNIYILLHNKEFLRASNTSKILNLQRNSNSNLILKFLIIGFWEHEKRLEKLLNDNLFVENSIILYPDKNSITSSNFYENMTNKFNNDENRLKCYFENLNIIVLDGTWSQTSNLKRLLDDLLDCKINGNVSFECFDDKIGESQMNFDEENSKKIYNSDNTFQNFQDEDKNNKKYLNNRIISVSIRFDCDNKKNIFENLRKSHSEEKCSTVEALAILLTDLGFDIGIYETIMENMRVFVERLCKQNRKKIEN